MKKKPRFFCDNCGQEVGHEVKACPHCGRFFASVRCPSCGFSGAEKMFLNGCPMCGYSAPPDNSKHSKTRQFGEKPARASPGLSFWTLFFAFLALIAGVLLFSWILTR